jgi:uncharacterized protein YjbJ (UPF0337 family)
MFANVQSVSGHLAYYFRPFAAVHDEFDSPVPGSLQGAERGFSRALLASNTSRVCRVLSWQRAGRKKRRNTMKRSTKNQAKGRFHEAKGKVKETTGKLIDDPDLEAEGKGEKIAGKVQKKIGQVEKVVGK